MLNPTCRQQLDFIFVTASELLVLWKSNSVHLEITASPSRASTVLSPRLYRQTQGEKLHLAVPPSFMCCQFKREQKREPSLLIDRSGTVREAETTIQTFWFQLTQNQLKMYFLGWGFSLPHPSWDIIITSHWSLCSPSFPSSGCFDFGTGSPLKWWK